VVDWDQNLDQILKLPDTGPDEWDWVGGDG